MDCMLDVTYELHALIMHEDTEQQTLPNSQKIKKHVSI